MANKNELARSDSGGVSRVNGYESLEEFRLACQNFTQRLNSQPNAESIGKTADGKAHTVTISHIEMTLDEYFFGLWETENFRWEMVTNEIVGSIDLVVTHPATGQRLRRTGAAAITIMVDAVPEEIKYDKQARNAWALNPMNKKPSALDMGFPKLKAECLKNAAQSFGKLFGRDLNRTIRDEFHGLVQKIELEDLQALYDLKKDALGLGDRVNAERILNTQEKASYSKLHRQLSSL